LVKNYAEREKVLRFDLPVEEKALLFSDAIEDSIPADHGNPQVVYRLAGDTSLLVEYGEMRLDLNLTFRVYSLDQALKAKQLDGLLETAPGVRSLLITYDCLLLPLKELISELHGIEKNLPPLGQGEVSSRILHLPIAYHDRWTLGAIARYMKEVRSQAPNLPDNVEFVARCNGLEGVEQVIEYNTASQHIVLGLGDVYLGAPCAVPLDPRYRLVTPKYNPARLWTPEGAVGIGGAYICIYPMESPGGYQLIGRTLPIWNTYQTSPAFSENPWLLRPFDRIQFEPVSESDLEEARLAMQSKEGYNLRAEDGTFRLAEYNAFLEQIKDESEQFKRQQRDSVLRSTEGY